MSRANYYNFSSPLVRSIYHFGAKYIEIRKQEDLFPIVTYNKNNMPINIGQCNVSSQGQTQLWEQ